MSRSLYHKKAPNLAGLFQSLNESLIPDSSGNVSFEAFSHDAAVTTLSTFINFGSEVPRPIRTGLICRAISETARSGQLTEKRFHHQLGKGLQDYLEKKPTNFHFYTSLSFIRPDHLKMIRIRGTTFNFRTGDHLRLSREGLRLHGDLRAELRSAALYTRVFFKTQARCYQSAVEKAFDQLDFFRGLWNLTHLVSETRWSSGIHKPVNTITLGPIHTIHTSDGNLAAEVYWYEPFFSKDQQAIHLTGKYDEVRRFEKRLVRALNEKPIILQEQLTQGVVRYCRALDQVDYEAAFLKLWGVLEFLTHTVGGSYDQTIKRTAFIFQDRESSKLTLEHLRQMRNRSVHSGESSEHEQGEKILYQLKWFVRRLICFHFTTSFKFKDLHEAGLFLETTTDRQALLSNLERNKNAWKFQRFDQEGDDQDVSEQ